MEAAFGAIGVQTSFSTLVMALPNLSPSTISRLMVDNAAKIFNVKLPTIEVGSICNVTVFNKAQTWHYSLQNNNSKAHNSPLLNTNLHGKIVACINNNQVFINR